jgi:sugar phosphate isomerase/epimerase
MVQTMFDVHNAIDEREEHSELIRKYLPFIAHVHVNEPDGREPGAGDYDFAKLLSTLAELGYKGWISVEVFDFSRGAEEIARRARATLQAATPLSLQTI